MFQEKVKICKKSLKFIKSFGEKIWNFLTLKAIAVIFLDVLTVFLSSSGPALEPEQQVDPSDIVQNELRTLSNDNLTHNQNISLSSVIKYQQQKLKGFGLAPNPQVWKSIEIIISVILYF